MKAFWIILAIAGGLVLLVLIGVAIAVWTVDVNEFVAPVQAKVKSATGRELTIGGKVNLSLGLEPKIVFDDVRFGNAPWAKDKEFATVKHVEADVALLPLLKKRFEVIRLTLVEPRISLETGPGGKVNWDFGGTGSAPAPGAASAGAASMLAIVRHRAGRNRERQRHLPRRCVRQRYAGRDRPLHGAGADADLADQHRVQGLCR